MEAIHRGMPDFEGIVETGPLNASDEQARKKDIIKARKKVNLQKLLLLTIYLCFYWLQFADAVLKQLGSQKRQYVRSG